MVEIVYSNRFLKHETGNHPEKKERLTAIKAFLEKKGFKRFKKPFLPKEKDLFSVHSPRLIAELKRRSREKASTLDNIFNPNTFEIALLAAGAALKAARLSRKKFAFSLARPPGHHSGKEFFGGFCYLNNLAFAVRSMQKEKGFGKAMIVDFDMHHGNGTQDIFYQDESVFYLSLHQDPAFTFPGTGFKRENNSHVRNVPIGEKTGDKAYLRVFKRHFNECFDSFQPSLLAVSAGFDAHAADAGFVGSRIGIRESSTFQRIGEEINSRAARARVPCFAVLEGGYDLGELPKNVFSFLRAFE